MTDGNEFEHAVELIHTRYLMYGKRGKPEYSNKWTHLASFFCVHKKSREIDILSVCTGTKCATNSPENHTGCRVLDSHAEVLARRSFVRYCLREISKSTNDSEYSCKFMKRVGRKFDWKSDFELYLYSSHVPCGGSSVSVNTQSDDYSPIVKFARHDVISLNPAHVFCRKPGRGEETLSMSCSDKLAKWNIMGVQGGILANLLHSPIFLTGIVLPKTFRCCKDDLIESVGGRGMAWVCTLPQFSSHFPVVHFVDKIFQYSPTNVTKSHPNSQASHLSFIWMCDIDIPEVLVDGFKQGVSKAKRHSQQSCSLVSRRNMLLLYGTIIDVHELGNYRSHKDYDYLNSWNALKSYFAHWNMHPDKLIAQEFILPK